MALLRRTGQDQELEFPDARLTDHWSLLTAYYSPARPAGLPRRRRIGGIAESRSEWDHPGRTTPDICVALPICLQQHAKRNHTPISALRSYPLYPPERIGGGARACAPAVRCSARRGAGCLTCCFADCLVGRPHVFRTDPRSSAPSTAPAPSTTVAPCKLRTIQRHYPFAPSILPNELAPRFEQFGASPP